MPPEQDAPRQFPICVDVQELRWRVELHGREIEELRNQQQMIKTDLDRMIALLNHIRWGVLGVVFGFGLEASGLMGLLKTVLV